MSKANSLQGTKYVLVPSLLFVLLMITLSGCGNNASNSGSGTPSNPGVGSVTVSGATILRDGTRWVPHGFYQIAFEVPTNNLSNELPFWTTAQQNYTSTEYTQMVQFGADSVRLQVAQTGMDPNGLYYSLAYSNLAIGAIRSARAAGLTVIVSVQDEPQTGETSPLGLPGPATQRVWQVLAPLFASDQGVVFELFNEPYIGTYSDIVAPSTSDWSAWAAAMNTTIATVRGYAPNNTIIVDGLDYAEQLTGAPTLADPKHQIIYSAHPYSHSSDDQKPASWDFRFGNFAVNNPVMISEWGDGYYCDDSTGTASQAFILYLQTHGIGLEAGAWDWSPLGFGTAMEGFPNNIVTTFPPAGTPLCNNQGQLLTKLGPGKLVQTWYQTGIASPVLQ